jgi:hypothetical protein
MKRAVRQGTRAEQLFFADPALDGVMGMLMTLATEHYVLRDRVQALEHLLIQSGQVDAAVLAQAPRAAEVAASNAEATAFATELLRPLLGLQDAVGATGRFSLQKKRRRARS